MTHSTAAIRLVNAPIMNSTIRSGRSMKPTLHFSTSDSVASFITHQHNCIAKAGDVWITAAFTAPDSNYVFTQQETQEGSWSDNLPGLVYVTVATS